MVYQSDKGAPQTPPSQSSISPITQLPGKSGGTEGILSDVAKIFSDGILTIIVLSTPEDYDIRETIITFPVRF